VATKKRGPDVLVYRIERRLYQVEVSCNINGVARGHRLIRSVGYWLKRRKVYPLSAGERKDGDKRFFENGKKKRGRARQSNASMSRGGPKGERGPFRIKRMSSVIHEGQRGVKIKASKVFYKALEENLEWRECS